MFDIKQRRVLAPYLARAPPRDDLPRRRSPKLDGTQELLAQCEGCADAWDARMIVAI